MGQSRIMRSHSCSGYCAEVAARALWNLAYNSKANQSRLVDAGAIGVLVHLAPPRRRALLLPYERKILVHARGQVWRASE